MAPVDSDIIDDELDLDAAVDAAAELAGDPAGAVDLESVLEAESGAELSGDDGPRRYDFNRPHSMSRGFEKNLQAVAENFAKTATIDFTSLLRTTVQVEYKGLRQTSFGDYQADLPNPTAAALVTLEPLKGPTLLQLDLNLCFVFMQKLMGGALDAEGPKREFTEIERGICANLVDRFTDLVRRSLANWTEVAPRLLKLENNPSYLTGIAEGESLIIARFHVAAAPAEGQVELVFPLAAFGPVRDVFDPRESLELRDERELRDDRRRILNMVQGTTSEVVVVLGEKPTNLEEILNLTEGDLIPLPQAVQAPLKVTVEGQDAWLGEAGRLGQKRAVKLVRPLTKE